MAKQIKNSICGNGQGIEQAWYCFLEDIVEFPFYKQSEHSYITDFIMATDGLFAKIDSDYTSAQYTEEQKINERGSYFEQQISGFTVNIEKDRLLHYRQTENKQIIVIFLTVDGQYRIMGNKKQGAKLIVVDNTETVGGGIPGTEYKIVKNHKERAPYYLGLTNLDSLGNLIPYANFDVDFSVSDTTITEGTTITFTDLSTNAPTSWFWEFGDGGTSTSQNPNYTYANAGNYTVKLTATKSGVSKSKTKLYYIFVSPPSASPSGIAYHLIVPSQFYSYDTNGYDTGGRVQSGFYNETQPTYPVSYAQLDTANATPFFRLKENNIFGNKLRFTDVTGAQTFSATGKKDSIFMDHYLKRIITARRNAPSIIGGSNWQDCIDNAASFSITVDGVTYSNWWRPSFEEIIAVFGEIAPGSALMDGIIEICAAGSVNQCCSDTNPFNTAQTFYIDSVGIKNAYSKGGGYGGLHLAFHKFI